MGSTLGPLDGAPLQDLEIQFNDGPDVRPTILLVVWAPCFFARMECRYGAGLVA
jgi:hypothetical protein